MEVRHSFETSAPSARVAEHVPYVSPKTELPELTLRALLLGVILSVVLGAANAYLGLRVGLTVSASIPAAVVSLGILKLLGRTNVIENNAVQTAASAGESLAAGVIFTIPALVMMNYWPHVHYLETTAIALVGGVLGVLFTVPLRRALIVEAQLMFPEGIATAEVLKTGDRGAAGGLMALAVGALAGMVFKFMQTGMRMWTETALYVKRFGQNGVVGFGSDLAPALLGVGYIIGLRIAVLVFAGGVMGWLIAIPIYSAFAGDAASFAAAAGSDVAFGIWSARVRYIGVGAMLVGGVWSLVKLRQPLGQALTKSWASMRGGPVEAPIRTERELSARATFLGVVGMVVPIMALYWYVTESIGIAIIMALLMIVTGFLFSAVGAYMAGLVGSSNNPISGVTILTVLAAAFTLLALGVDSSLGPAATIMVAGVIAAAGAIASDNMQDLKTGYLLGATPRRQQVMQVVGVSALAFTIAPVLNLLHEAYTFGTPRLAAPQAGLMQAVAGFVFDGGLPADMMAIGAGLAVLLILLDEWLRLRDATFRTPVMPVAVGIYLPVGLSTPIFLGGLIAWFTGRRFAKSQTEDKPGKGAAFWDKAAIDGHRQGILFSSGLIAGEALIGILVAALLVTIGVEITHGDGTIETILPFSLDGTGGLQWPGVLLFGYLIALMMHFVWRPARSDGTD